MASRAFRLEQLPAAVREHRRSVSTEWRRFRSLQGFIEDHFPLEWEEIRRCGLNPAIERDIQDGTRYALRPPSCRKVPFCIRCVKAQTTRRVLEALGQFGACTPAGKKPAFVHIVQTAPVGNDGQYAGGGDWGRQAASDVETFGKIVWEVLREAYGDGIGGVMSFQRFGERGFAKLHPHMDLTLNGWTLQGDGMARTPRYEFRGSGKDRWHAATRKAAGRHYPGAEGGNVRVHTPLVGTKAYYRVLRYQMRELVDLRKLEYSRDAKTVWWKSYHENRREKFALNDFLAGLAEYKWRLGAWRGKDDEAGTQRLHRRYGHMSDRRITNTQILVGGAIPTHGAKCPCRSCGDWERVYPDGIDRACRPLASVRG